MTDPIALFLPVFTPNIAALMDAPGRFARPSFTEAPGAGADEPDAGADFEAVDLDLPDMAAPESGFLGDDLASRGDDEGARIAQARDEALAEAAIATEAALAAQAADLESRHADILANSLAEERRRWVEQEAATMTEQLRNGLAALEMLLAEGVADILKPVLDKAMRAQAAEELRQAVTQILATPDAPLIRIGGPADLVEPLRSAFAPEAAIEVVASDEPEVTIEAGDTTIRTQLQAWAATLDGHLGEAN